MSLPVVMGLTQTVHLLHIDIHGDVFCVGCALLFTFFCFDLSYVTVAYFKIEHIMLVVRFT